MVTLEQVLLATLPFADELLEWCDKQPEFRRALKVIYSNRFLHLGGIITSYSPNYPDDEVIGVFSYDYKIKHPIFKQDFIVNKKKEYKEFVLYTRNPGGSSKWVKDINQFFSTYGKGGLYIHTHHLSFDELPEEFKERGERVIKLAEKIIQAGGYTPSQEKIEDIYQQVLDEKKKPWMTKKKLK